MHMPYKRPARYDDVIAIRTSLEFLRGSMMRFKYAWSAKATGANWSKAKRRT